MKKENDGYHMECSFMFFTLLLVLLGRECYVRLSRTGDKRITYKMLVGKFLGKKPFGRLRYWDDTIKMNRDEVNIEDVNWIASI